VFISNLPTIDVSIAWYLYSVIRNLTETKNTMEESSLSVIVLKLYPEIISFELV